MVRPVITATVIVALTVCAVSGYFFYKKWKKSEPPRKWRKIGNVLKLFVYPLKSGRYIEPKTVTCTPFGFSLPENENLFQLRDRSFIVYGEPDLVGKSARIYPGMVLISISSHDKKHVKFQAPNVPVLIVEVPSKSENNVKKINFQSWSDEYVQTIDCGDEAAKWFSQFLIQKDSGLRLGYHDISSYRTLKSFKNRNALKFYEYLSDSAFGLYADLAAGLLVNEKSVMDLNEKLEKKVTRIHFRPNIVVDDPDLLPFAEDDWLWIKVGDVLFKNIKDCQRCVLTTVDPETGVRDITREPLKTLSKYRVSKGPGHGPIMGVNLEVVTPGTINLDDEIFTGVEE